jgi:high-affinity iron transporter
MMYIAAGFLIWMIVWMARRKNISQDLKNQTQVALETSAWAVAGVAFVAVMREGFETAIFLFASGKLTGGLSWFSALLGILVSIGIGLLLFRHGKKLPIKTFFNATSVFLIFVAAGMMAYGTHEMEEFIVEGHEEEHQQEVSAGKPVAAVAESQSSQSLHAGTSQQLQASINPARWESEDQVARPFQLFEELSEQPEGVNWVYSKTEGGDYVHILHEKGSIGQYLKAFFGYNSNPNWLEFTLWLLTVAGGFFYWYRS